MSPMTAMSSWMEVAGWTLVHFVWQGGLIALMVAATLRVGRRWPSEARYIVACGGLVAMVMVPIATTLVLSSTSQRPLTSVASLARKATVVSGRVRAEREHACDDVALGVCGDRVAYAAALTELEGLRGRDRAPALAATQGSLVARVRRILRVPVEATPGSPGWVTTLLLGVVCTTGVVGMVDLPSAGRGGGVATVSAVQEQDVDAALAPEHRAPQQLQHAEEVYRTLSVQQEEDRQARLTGDIKESQRRAVDLADEEADIADEVAALGSLSDQDRLDSLNRLMKRKEEMENEVADLERGLDSTSAEFRRDERDASRALQDAANGIRESQLKEKIRYSRGLVRARSPEYAREFEAEIGEDIADLQRTLAVAAEAVGKSEGTGLEQVPQPPPAGNEVSFDWRVYETDHGRARVSDGGLGRAVTIRRHDRRLRAEPPGP